MPTISRPILRLKVHTSEPSAKPAQLAKPSQPPEPLLEKFYFVWARDGMRPKRRHASAESAHAEAIRLCGIAPERQFLVYEARLLEVAP
jgi:hypothetical protein